MDLGARLSVLPPLMIDDVAERVPGRDYDAGVKRYAFAAPFTKIGPTAAAPPIAT